MPTGELSRCAAKQDAVRSTVWPPPPTTGCPKTIIRGRTTMSIEARTTGLRLGAIGIGLLLAAVLGSTAVAADLKIGFPLSLTRGTDDYGKGARMGAELALKEYNDKGGYQ